MGYARVFADLYDDLLVALLIRRGRELRKERGRMVVFAHDFIGAHVNVFGYYELRELTALKQRLQELVGDGIVLDVGANIGNHSLFFSELGFSEIHAFEPNPDTFAILTLNTQHVPSIHRHNIALSDKKGTAIAAVPQDNAGGASISKKRHNDCDDEITFTISDFESLDITDRKICLIKIDIEGHEAEAFRGMQKMLERHRPMVLFECNLRSQPENALRALETLRASGYAEFHSVGPPQSVVNDRMPSLVRRPLRVIEKMFRPAMTVHQIVRVPEFKPINYPLVIALPLHNAKPSTSCGIG